MFAWLVLVEPLGMWELLAMTLTRRDVIPALLT